MKKLAQNGFTLIELLVVIAIIGILSSVVLGNVRSGHVKARDTRRKEDLDQIAKAINIYFSQNGTLPRSTGFCSSISNPSGLPFQSDISPTFMATVPLDPTKANLAGDYLFSNTDTNAGKYSVCAIMENATGNSYDYSSCTGGGVYNYCITQ